MAKILIIGGGVAGLSAGIYARLAGHEALLCEQGQVLGGNLTGWRRGPYEIDNCIHWLTGTNPVSGSFEMWRELGALGEPDVFQGEALYSSEREGKVLALSRDLDRFEADLLDLSPSDEKEILRLTGTVRLLQKMAGIGGKAHNEGLDRREKIRLFPALGPFYRETCGDLAARFSHPLIRTFLTDLLTEGFGSLALLLVMAHFCGDNGGIPAGSSRGMAKRMEERFRALGGEVLTGKEAVRIETSGQRARSVTFGDGDRIPADFVVTTLEPTQVFCRLLNKAVPPVFLRRYGSKRTARFSACHTAFACGTDALPFRGERILPLSGDAARLFGSGRMVLREFTHEKQFAPSGETVLQTMTICDEATSRGYLALKKDPAAYREQKNALAKEAGAVIENRFPELRGKIRPLDVWTPATYRRYVNSQIGSFMGFAFSSRVLPLWANNRVKGVENLILAGQWLQSPGGLPIAAESGKRAVETIGRLCRKA